MNKRNEKNKKRIRLKIKKARKLFATSVSRGINPINQSADLSIKKKEDKEEGKEEDGEDNRGRLFSSLANYALCKQLDGTLDFEEGTTGWWNARTSKGYGYILKKDYDVSANFNREEYQKFLKTPIPSEALKNAYMFRVLLYERLLDANDIVRSLPITPSVICFKMFKGIYNAPGGVVPMPKFWEKSCGGHCVMIYAYDNKKRVLKFLNSWGGEWGDDGKGCLSYDYVNKYLIEAWITRENFLEKKEQKENKIEKIGDFDYEFLAYKSVIFGRQPIYVIDVYDNNQITGWAHFHFDDCGKSITIEDIFVMPIYRKRGIGQQFLTFIENIAVRYFVPEIICYVHIQDLVFLENQIAIENLFKAENYEILSCRKQFKGCVYRIVRNYL